MKHPKRTCVGCRRLRPKRELVRIVRRPDGNAEVDPSGSAPGRGAYVCGPDCLVQAARRLARAVRAERVDVEGLAAGVADGTREET